MTDHKHLKRLEQVWGNEPVFFITCCTQQRKPILANAKIVSILVEEWTGALERHGWVIGRYVVMPDHVHFFCAPLLGAGMEKTGSAIEGRTGSPIDVRTGSPIEGRTGSPIPSTRGQTYKGLSGFMQQWKQWTSKRIIRECGCSSDRPSGLQAPIWQAEFFDHLLRSQESYGQKWEYVRQNPLRAGLVQNPEDWLWQGEIYAL